jgi:hypothetical protein
MLAGLTLTILLILLILSRAFFACRLAGLWQADSSPPNLAPAPLRVGFVNAQRLGFPALHFDVIYASHLCNLAGCKALWRGFQGSVNGQALISGFGAACVLCCVLAGVRVGATVARVDEADCELHCSLQKFFSRCYQQVGGEIGGCEHGRELGYGLE